MLKKKLIKIKTDIEESYKFFKTTKEVSEFYKVKLNSTISKIINDSACINGTLYVRIDNAKMIILEE